MALNRYQTPRRLTLMGQTVTFDNDVTAAALRSLNEQANKINLTLGVVNERVAPSRDSGLLRDFKALLVEHVQPPPAPPSVPAPVTVTVPLPQPPTMPVIATKDAMDRIRLLVQVLTLAVDKEPGQPAEGRRAGSGASGWGENVALAGLRQHAEQLPDNLGHLKGDYAKSLESFTTKEQLERAQRLAFVHDLIRSVAQHLK